MTAKKTLCGYIFCFLLTLLCISNISYATPADEVDFTLLAIGIHYEGQPDTTWVVKDVTNSPLFPIIQGQTYSATELGIANDLSAGTVDKIALKGILTISGGGGGGTGWLTESEPVDGQIPPASAVNFLNIDGGLNIPLEEYSNKKFLVKWGPNGAQGGPIGVVISDM